MAGLVVQLQGHLQGHLQDSLLLPTYLNASGLATTVTAMLSSLLVLGSCAVQAVVGRPDATPRVRREGAVLKRSVDSFIQTETPIAWNKLLCNIGPSGCAASGAASGAVIASPSKSSPDCECFCLRSP